MRKFSLILLLLIALQSTSQPLAGYQLKPPIVTIHFGSGQVSDINNGGVYSYGQVRTACPTDGHYSFVPSTSDCFRGDWHTLTEDHTSGDSYGNMLLVNASYDGGAFLSTTVSSLKPGAIYELGFWIMNVWSSVNVCQSPLKQSLVDGTNE